MSQSAYSLREAFTGTVDQVLDPAKPDEVSTVPLFSGGVISAGDAGELNLAEALASGDGVIVVSDLDPSLIVALDAVPALKRTTVPDGAQAIRRYSLMARSDLDAEAERRGIARNVNREDLEAALIADDEHPAGEQPAAEVADESPTATGPVHAVDPTSTPEAADAATPAAEGAVDPTATPNPNAPGAEDAPADVPAAKAARRSRPSA